MVNSRRVLTDEPKGDRVFVITSVIGSDGGDNHNDYIEHNQANKYWNSDEHPAQNPGDHYVNRDADIVVDGRFTMLVNNVES